MVTLKRFSSKSGSCSFLIVAFFNTSLACLRPRSQALSTGGSAGGGGGGSSSTAGPAQGLLGMRGCGPPGGAPLGEKGSGFVISE